MPGDTRSWSMVWEAPDREIGKHGENRGKVIAHLYHLSLPHSLPGAFLDGVE